MKETIRVSTTCMVIMTMAVALTHANSLRINSTPQGFPSAMSRSFDFPKQSKVNPEIEEAGTKRALPKQSSQDLTQWPMECEGAAAQLDYATVDTQKTPGTYLIVVARLGTGETSSILNRTRLALAGEYLRRRGPELKYVLAQGDRVKGLGRLELYVGGRLREIMPLKRNAKGYCVAGRGWDQ